MSGKTSYILWLPSWYPNKLQPYNGDFVKRHAEAASAYVNIEVIHVVKDEKGIVTKDILIDKRRQGNLSETIIYYYFPKRFPSVINRYRSHQKYIDIYKQQIEEQVTVRGAPALVHIYIALKAGVLSEWMKKKYGVPYVVSEQSTIYLDEAKPNFSGQNIFFQKAAKKIYRNAASVMVVSDYLGNALKKKFSIVQPVLIPNVVDDKIFHYNELSKLEDQKSFIHISTLNYQKNAEAIIEAFKRVVDAGTNCRLNIVGPQVPELADQVIKYGLDQHVSFHHEMPQQQLVHLVQQSDAMILFSRYETFGCVMIEAFACGVPVILSDIPVFHENADSSNALFARDGDAGDLADKILQFVQQPNRFERKQISRSAIDKYNYSRVGALIKEWYDDILKIIGA